MRHFGAIVAATAVVLLSVAGAGARESAARVIDRTLVCTTGLQAGIHEIDLAVTAGFRASSGGPLQGLPRLELTTPGVPVAGPDEWFVASIAAGRTRDAEGGTVALSRNRCRARAERIGLVPTGLRAREARAIGDSYECAVPARIVVRVRGVFDVPATLRRNRFGYLNAVGGVARSARLAVRTLAGKPLVYADVSESGRARLFTTPGCAAQ